MTDAHRRMEARVGTASAQRLITTIEGSRSAVAPRYNPDDPLLTAREAAAERRQGLATFYRDVAAGRVPTALLCSAKKSSLATNCLH
jgi:hypothetical protein